MRKGGGYYTETLPRGADSCGVCMVEDNYLLPKGYGEFRGIGIVEVIWKAVSGVVSCWIEVAANFLISLHGFSSGRVMETASPEANLIHQQKEMR